MSAHIAHLPPSDSKNSIRANAAAFAGAIRTTIATADLDHPRRKLRKVIFNAKLAMATWICCPPSGRVHRHTASHRHLSVCARAHYGKIRVNIPSHVSVESSYNTREHEHTHLLTPHSAGMNRLELGERYLKRTYGQRRQWSWAP